jgi:hypothetical protein
MDSLLSLLLDGSRMRATAACVVDASVRDRFPGLATVLPKIVATLSALVWWVVWKPRCSRVGPIDSIPDGPIQSVTCSCHVCSAARPGEDHVHQECDPPAVVAAHFAHERAAGVTPLVGAEQNSLRPVPLPVWTHFGAVPGLSHPRFGLRPSCARFASHVEVRTGPELSHFSCSFSVA